MPNVNIEGLLAPVYFGNGSNRTKIATDGTVTFEGTAAGYEDISGYLNSASIASTPGKADYDETEDLIVMEPSGSINTLADLVAVKFQLKHQHKTNTPMKLHIHWRQPSSGAYQFTYKYRYANNGGETSLTWSDPVVVTATGANNAYIYVSGNLNQITMLGEIPTTGLTLSSIVQVKIARTDAVAGNIYIYDIDAHIEVDSAAGSATLYTK